ncbi:MAG: hypothetical protein IPO62_08285 [Saprospiraceae bacterium]|nr:hypothetical protein [Saprospiraceae bacterium]
MDFQAIRKLTTKFEQILELYSDHEELSQSEKDLMIDYLKRIFNQIQQIDTIQESKVVIQQFETTMATSHQSNKAIHNTDLDPARGGVRSNNTNGHSNQHQDIPPVDSEKLEEQHSINSKYSSIFDCLKISDLSEKLELTPIKDLKNGMGLNEKILAQQELFGGDKDSFNKAISDLNECSNLENAKNYLIQNVIPKYHWDKPDKEKFVDSFLKHIQRRFL